VPIAYPQPAGDKITFGYSLSSASAIKIYVYNIMGTQVAVFEQAINKAGTNTAVFSVRKFTPGMYFYIIKVPGTDIKFKATKFMVER
jgi:hypothetical protein